MIKKSITYKTYDKPPRTVTEDFYFDINKLEALELELETGGLQETLEQLTKTSDAKQAYKLFKGVLLSAVGVKSKDNKGFDKKDADGVPYSVKFEGSNALGELIIELIGDSDYASEFVAGLLPDGWQEEQAARNPTSDQITQQVQEAAARQENPETAVEPSAPPVAPEPKALKPVKDYSRDELLALSDEDFERVAGKNPQQMTKRVLEVAVQRKMR